jgi:hypothetical protein
MSFSAHTFIYNGVPSEFHRVFLGDIGNSTAGGGEATSDASNNSTVLSEKIFRRPTLFNYGVEMVAPLQFPLSMYVEGEGLDEREYSQVASWLFGNQNYKKLRICQNDLQEVFWNAVFIDGKKITAGNYVRGITATVSCDSPWGFLNPKTTLYSWDNVPSISDTINYINTSDNNYYTFPKLVITANSFAGDVTITNVTDNNRQFILSMEANEVVEMDCSLQTIISTVSIYPIQNFNLKFLRFLPGLNQLTISGNILSLSVTSEIAVKVGG